MLVSFDVSHFVSSRQKTANVSLFEYEQGPLMSGHLLETSRNILNYSRSEFVIFDCFNSSLHWTFSLSFLFTFIQWSMSVSFAAFYFWRHRWWKKFWWRFNANFLWEGLSFPRSLWRKHHFPQRFVLSRSCVPVSHNKTAQKKLLKLRPIISEAILLTYRTTPELNITKLVKDSILVTN